MPDPNPVSVATPNVLDFQFIRVTLRTDFRRVDAHGKILFDWAGEPIPSATVELRSGATLFDSATTDNDGRVALDASQIPDGDCIIRVTPLHSVAQFAGPDIVESDPAPLPLRMYHPLDVPVKISQGLMAQASLDSKLKFASLGNRSQPKWPPDAMPTDHLPIDLKPIWIKSPHSDDWTIRNRVRPGSIELFVIHNTGADDKKDSHGVVIEKVEARIGPSINQFKDGGAEIHYLMDFNGHIIKFMKDKMISFHAGGRWKQQGSNEFSIGIELVHKEAGIHEYTDEQYAALQEFIQLIMRAYPTIKNSQIAGHSDVGTRLKANSNGPIDRILLDGDREQDPGQVFRWEKLEAQGLGMIPGAVALTGAYGGLFDLATPVVLREGDNDARQIYGGKHLPATPPRTAITELQNDLQDIGYSISAVNGSFDTYTGYAAWAFQRHFFSGARRRAANQHVDKDTAQMIKNAKGP